MDVDPWAGMETYPKPEPISATIGRIRAKLFRKVIRVPEKGKNKEIEGPKSIKPDNVKGDKNG